MSNTSKTWPLPDATDIAAMIRRKDITPLEAVDDAIARAEVLQPQLNFMVTSMYEEARARAKMMPINGPFAGVPYLIKDKYDVKGVPTRWGSRFTSQLPPAAESCIQVTAFEAAGLVVFGKSSLGEGGFLPTTEPLAFGATRNPWDLSLSAGGSSGGAAAAVAAGVLPFADGTDGAGSIRIPASACGLFGLKPSRGRLIGDHTSSTSIELTAEHCLSRSVRDSAALFAAMERKGQPAAFASVKGATGPSKRRLRVGFLVSSLNNRQPESEIAKGVEETVKLLEDLGHAVAPTAWPLDGPAFLDNFSHMWMLGGLKAIEVARAVAGTQSIESLVEPFTLDMARRATKLSPEDVDKVTIHLLKASAAYDSWFENFDVILSPTLLTPSVPIGHITGDLSFETGWERFLDFASYTELQNVAGAPAMTVPLHWTAGGLPVGMQLGARRGDDRTLFELAYELEAARPWAMRRPSILD